MFSLCRRESLHRLYSTKVSPEALRKWGVGAIQRPPSLFADNDSAPVDLSEDDDLVNGLRPNTKPIHKRKPPKTPTPAEYASHRAVMREKYPDGWNPPKKISREAMDGLRTLHSSNPDIFTTPVLADKFRISPEAVRRILKSRWAPSREKQKEGARRDRRSYEEFVSLERVRERLEMQKVTEARDAVAGRKRGDGDRLFFGE